jgi:CRISPR-associated protein (TIGR03986 family)
VEPCSTVNEGRDTVELCPACRVFGWVQREAREKQDTNEAGRTPADEASRANGKEDVRAVRSRVRFSDALFIDPETRKAAVPEPVDATLPILSAPKPSAVRFYLMPADGDLRRSDPRDEAGYDNEALVVRGRKFYRRSSNSPQVEERNKQNRTLRDVMPDGCSAGFEVRFENLAAVELGALLWALELESGWMHRLGFGKPLGYGDVTIAVEEVELWTAERWEHSTATAGEEADRPTASPDVLVARLKDRFRGAMARRYTQPSAPASEFARLHNIADLASLLGKKPGLDVTYPLVSEQRGFLDVMNAGEIAETSPESYRWFTQNRRKEGGHWLDLASGDGGLPWEPTQA